MADSSQPTFITVDAQGRIRYDFDGRISARGVDLVASAAATPEASRAIRWNRESDGAMVARVSGHTQGTQDFAILGVGENAGTARYAAVRPRTSPLGGGVGSVLVDARNDGGVDYFRTLLDGRGASHALQVSDQPSAGTAKRSRVGSVTVTWPGAQAWATSPAIVHNWNVPGGVRLLGAAAREYFASPTPTGPLAIGAIGNGANQLALIATIGQGFGIPAAGTQQVIDYLICEA